MISLKKITALIVASFFLILIISFVWIYLLIKDLPSSDVFESRKVNESTKIYDSTGKVLLFEIYGEEKRTIIPLEEISENIKNATLAVEDASFYNHSALELKSTIRAVIANILNREYSQGGSTITQQLAKKAFLSDEKKISRKIKELILAYRLEKKYSKDQILELYLNQIPYGNNSYGIESASLAFFGKSAKDLDLAQSALLAALPQAPSFYSPWGKNVKALMFRKDYVLERMFQEHYISEEEKNNAQKEEIKFESPSQNIKAPHFVMMVKDYLDKEYGEEAVRTGGLKVITTLNWEIQQAAEKILTAGVERNAQNYKGTNASLVVEDPKTGQILALVGSKDYFDIENDGNFNVAYQGLRQPGSSLKPIIYASLFKKGFIPESIIFDTETEFDTTEIPENSYKPQNYTGTFRGPMDVRHALAQSINVPAVKALYLSGLDNALKTASDFGLKTLTEKGRYGLSLVLGGGEVTLYDLVGAYSVFSQEGVKKDQKIILEISDKKRVLEKYQENPGKSVIDPLYSNMITDILSDSEARRQVFGGSLDIPQLSDYQIAVKTGTSNDYKDAWTVGYTPNLVIGLWAGNNDNSPMTKEGASIYAAVPIWKDLMSAILPKFTPELFNKPIYELPEKPILKGEYITNFESNGINYPQIHDTLFYVDKNDPLGNIPDNPEKDPQFKNWEDSVILWASKNIQNWSDFNKPIPLDAVISQTNSSNIDQIKIKILSPFNGEFINSNNIFNINTDIESKNEIKSIELFFNDFLIDKIEKNNFINLGNNYKYQRSINVSNPKNQNLLKITITDINNFKKESSVIIFK